MYYLAYLQSVFVVSCRLVVRSSAFGAARRVFDSLRHPPELGTLIRSSIPWFKSSIVSLSSTLPLHFLLLRGRVLGGLDGTCRLDLHMVVSANTMYS